ncbi:MAG TPA: ABC transporter substrate-binding protein [Devosiaceae bacterium]|nr:ABC transporter substrate-binding protein [Devosiaceae bacterium]
MKLKSLAFALAISAALTGPALATDLRIGIGEDPDALDPDQSRTFVGEVIFAAMCDKLVNITPDLTIIPQLATDWNWSGDGTELTMDLRKGVTFQDGTPFNAQAVVDNIDRSQHLPESRRKSELTSVKSVEAAGEYQVKFNLSAPDATLLATLAARSGAMMSPTAFKKDGLDFANHPVCAGPFEFKSRVQQDRIVLQKYPGYWDADKIKVDTVTYLPIPDATVRLANLRSGDLDIIERVAPTDAQSVKDDPSLTYADAPGIGYQGLTININNGTGAGNPFAKSNLLRQAFSLSIDRDALNQVVFNGAYTPGNQPASPKSPWYDQDLPVPARDVAKAEALMKQAGVDRVDLQLTVPNNPQSMQLAQVIQSMVAESGFKLNIKATEFATMLAAQTAGDYQADLVGWSGYVDPDANLNPFVTCNGGINDSKYCDPALDKLMQAGRASTDPAARKKAYDAARVILDRDLPLIYLYHPTWIWAMGKKVTGFVPYPDGLIRLEGVSKS